jgi:DNA-binding IclR family transcriptional regulator
MGGKVPAKYPVKSLAKALRLLETIGHYPNGASVTALSKQLRIGKSTVHRLLATLREFDLVWLDPETTNYALGTSILRWSDLLVRQNLLARHGLPVLRELVDVCRETASLAILETNEILYVAQFESMERLRMSQWVGSRMPAHCTSLGKALLSSLTDEQIDKLYPNDQPLKALTTNSITDKKRLIEHLQKVRQEGVAYDFEENMAGVVCMGAVVKNFSGKPVAAMSISMPIQRFRGETLMTFKDHLLRAANRLALELGYNPATSGADPDKALESPAQAVC